MATKKTKKKPIRKLTVKKTRVAALSQAAGGASSHFEAVSLGKAIASAVETTSAVKKGFDVTKAVWSAVSSVGSGTAIWGSVTAQKQLDQGKKDG